jgi:hypothetical protein
MCVLQPHVKSSAHAMEDCVCMTRARKLMQRSCDGSGGVCGEGAAVLDLELVLDLLREAHRQPAEQLARHGMIVFALHEWLRTHAVRRMMPCLCKRCKRPVRTRHFRMLADHECWLIMNAR